MPSEMHNLEVQLDQELKKLQDEVVAKQGGKYTEVQEASRAATDKQRQLVFKLRRQLSMNEITIDRITKGYAAKYN